MTKGRDDAFRASVLFSFGMLLYVWRGAGRPTVAGPSTAPACSAPPCFACQRCPNEEAIDGDDERARLEKAIRKAIRKPIRPQVIRPMVSPFQTTLRRLNVKMREWRKFRKKRSLQRSAKS